jgi:hypothetical protein
VHIEGSDELLGVVVVESSKDRDNDKLEVDTLRRGFFFDGGSDPGVIRPLVVVVVDVKEREVATAAPAPAVVAEGAEQEKEKGSVSASL